jgi:hypothetical protein
MLLKTLCNETYEDDKQTFWFFIIYFNFQKTIDYKRHKNDQFISIVKTIFKLKVISKIY